MSLYTRFAADGLPSFVTTNTYERSRIFTLAAHCELLIRTLYETRNETRFLLLAFTVMPDHLHLVLAPPQVSGLGRIMQLIKGRFSHAYNSLTGRTGPVWQSRYHERTLRSERALFRAIEYVHHNPIAARLAADVAAYPWSTASGRYATDLDERLGLGQAEA